MRRILFAIGITLLGGVGLPGGVKLEEDPPNVKPPRAGDITGTITPVAKVKELSLISRVSEQKYTPAGFDRQTGKFAFKKLPGDAAYDVCIKTTDGRELEGIDLDFLEQRMQRLAAERRKQLGLPPESTYKFGMDDVRMMVDHVKNMREFMEVHRPLYIRGHGKWATMLIELMRTREHYAGEGRLIWRVELWYWEYRHGGWERVPNQERLLRRLRETPEVWGRQNVQWFPELSAHVNADGFCPAVEFQIPDNSDIRRGRLPNTDPVQKVEPFVSGLDVQPQGELKEPATEEDAPKQPPKPAPPKEEQ